MSQTTEGRSDIFKRLFSQRSQLFLYLEAGLINPARRTCRYPSTTQPLLKRARVQEEQGQLRTLSRSASNGGIVKISSALSAKDGGCFRVSSVISGSGFGDEDRALTSSPVGSPSPSFCVTTEAPFAFRAETSAGAKTGLGCSAFKTVPSPSQFDARLRSLLCGGPGDNGAVPTTVGVGKGRGGHGAAAALLASEAAALSSAFAAVAARAAAKDLECQHLR